LVVLKGTIIYKIKVKKLYFWILSLIGKKEVKKAVKDLEKYKKKKYKSCEAWTNSVFYALSFITKLIKGWTAIII
jgi:hypothetical protein